MRVPLRVPVLFLIVAASLMAAITPSVAAANEEREAAQEACSLCHRHPDRLDRKIERVHREHSEAECRVCHVGDDTLEDAERAHGTVRWAALAASGAVVAGLALNYAVARKRIGSEGEN